MTSYLTRRDFLALAAAASAGLAVSCQLPPRKRPGYPLQYAAIGVGGMGATDLNQISAHPEVEVVALCDVDADNLAKASALHPAAKVYRDWRCLLQEQRHRLDAVSVTTPDHMHAPIALTAMALGLHVYCQKPLTHTVMEARQMAEVAVRKKVVTQMGIQNRAAAPYRQALQIFQQDLCGPIEEVHVWTDRPSGWWPQNTPRPQDQDPVPASLDWDLWLGVAPERPYKKGAYHPFVWRGRKDFGTGAQGDMACHLMDPALWFLGLSAPTQVRSEGPKPLADSFPEWSHIQYQFPPTTKTHARGVELHWYDGGQRPSEALQRFGIADPYANASLFLGKSGALLVSPYEPCRFFLPEQAEVKLTMPEVEVGNHWHQWVDACFGRQQTDAPFAYAALLTEVALLGNIALEFPQQNLHWNSSLMRFAARPDVDALLQPHYRAGWELRSGNTRL